MIAVTAQLHLEDIFVGQRFHAGQRGEAVQILTAKMIVFARAGGV